MRSWSTWSAVINSSIYSLFPQNDFFFSSSFAGCAGRRKGGAVTGTYDETHSLLVRVGARTLYTYAFDIIHTYIAFSHQGINQ